MTRKSSQSVEQVARAGDRRRTLEALRDRLARDLDEAPATVSAQLASQLRETLRELDALPIAEEASAVDEIAARRKARRATSSTDGAAASSDGKRRR